VQSGRHRVTQTLRHENPAENLEFRDRLEFRELEQRSRHIGPGAGVLRTQAAKESALLQELHPVLEPFRDFDQRQPVVGHPDGLAGHRPQVQLDPEEHPHRHADRAQNCAETLGLPVHPQKVQCHPPGHQIRKHPHQETPARRQEGVGLLPFRFRTQHHAGQKQNRPASVLTQLQSSRDTVDPRIRLQSRHLESGGATR